MVEHRDFPVTYVPCPLYLSFHTHILLSECNDIFNFLGNRKNADTAQIGREDQTTLEEKKPLIELVDYLNPSHTFPCRQQASSTSLTLTPFTRLLLSLTLTKQPSGYVKVSQEFNVFFASSEG